MGGDRRLLAGDGGAGHKTAFLPHGKAAGPHEFGDAIPAMPKPRLTQRVHDARAAINAAGGDKSALDFQAKSGILRAPFAQSLRRWA